MSKEGTKDGKGQTENKGQLKDNVGKTKDNEGQRRPDQGLHEGQIQESKRPNQIKDS